VLSGKISYELTKAVLARAQHEGVHENLRSLNRAQTRARELHDATLVPQPVAAPAPVPTPQVLRLRAVEVAKMV